MPVTIDVTGVDGLNPGIIGVGSQVTGTFVSGVAQIDLLPGGHRLFYNTSSNPLPRLVFEVAADGTFDAVYVIDAATGALVPGESYVSGLGTDTLAVHGAGITVDASALSTPNPSLNSIGSAVTGTFSPEGVADVSVLPGGQFLFYNTAALPITPRLLFTVTPDGNIGEATVVDFDPRDPAAALETTAAGELVSGLGTPLLEVNGARINVAAGGLDQATYGLFGIGSYETDTVDSFQLLPGPHRFRTPATGGADLDFDFVVRALGTVDYASDVVDSTPLTGRGTNLLVVGPVDPVELVVALTESVMELNLRNGISNSLDAKLNAASRTLDDLNDHNDAAAINTLQAFICEVRAQRGDELPEEVADDLIDDAEAIIVALGGSTASEACP